MPEVSAEFSMRFTLDAVNEVAKKLWVAGAKVSVWALYGELGAGKTTLVKAIVNEIGTSETIASPTFSIINQYRSRDAQTIYHFDFYRLKNETEAFDIGVDEYFDSGNLCLIEWPEKIPSLLPSSYFEIRIEIIDHHTRLIRYQTHG